MDYKPLTDIVSALRILTADQLYNALIQIPDGDLKDILEEKKYPNELQGPGPDEEK